MKQYRGAYRISRSMLSKRLGISPWLYKVEIDAAGDVVFYCYAAQDAITVTEGCEPVQVKIEDPRFCR